MGHNLLSVSPSFNALKNFLICKMIKKTFNENFILSVGALRDKLLMFDNRNITKF